MPIFKRKSSRSVHGWICKRSVLGTGGHGFNNGLDSQIYGSITCVRSWNSYESLKVSHCGGIFNFDFSTEGSIMVAACENNSYLVFDPLNGSLVGSKEKAHDDSVNCVKFLDSRMFATCSDDNTVRLWDIRSLKTNIFTLKDHRYWVKNIEYSKGMLVTSGFDGRINMWDINKLSPSAADPYSTPQHSSSSTDAPLSRRVYHMPGLMRCRISPDGSKLLLSTRLGFIMVIHDLNLETLMSDMSDFKPAIYYALQSGMMSSLAGMNADICRQMSHIFERKRIGQIFERKRNRVEFIADMPDSDEAEMIASMDVHPHNWSIVTRYSTRKDSCEWTCVHDIQGTRDEVQWDGNSHSSSHGDDSTTSLEGSYSNSEVNGVSIGSRDEDVPVSNLLIHLREYVNSSLRDSRDAIPLRHNLAYYIHPSGADAMSELSVAELYDADSEGDSEDIEQSTDPEESSSESSTGGRHSHNNPTVFSLNSTPNNHNSVRSTQGDTPQRHDSGVDQNNDSFAFQGELLKNQSRLTHFVMESKAGQGFIKEICYSSDGRLIASPFGYGVRLLSFDADCNEACDCRHDAPVSLNKLTCVVSHPGVVVATKFCPTQTLLVSGCLAGKVCFHQPVL